MNDVFSLYPFAKAYKTKQYKILNDTFDNII